MELAFLIKLQNVDKNIMKLESSIGDLPKQVENLKLKIASIKNDLNKYNDELSQCFEKKRKLEGNIELFKMKSKKYQEQMYLVTTNKEYDAISAEIDIKEKEIEESETNILELLEKEETLGKQIQNFEEQLTNNQSEFDDNTNILAEKIKKNEQELNKLSAERKSFVEKIKKPLYYNYERIRKGSNGIAIAEIINYTCHECFATIPAQTVVEVRKMNSIILCETCGRILICANNSINSK